MPLLRLVYGSGLCGYGSPRTHTTRSWLYTCPYAAYLVPRARLGSVWLVYTTGCHQFTGLHQLRLQVTCIAVPLHLLHAHYTRALPGYAFPGSAVSYLAAGRTPHVLTVGYALVYTLPPRTRGLHSSHVLGPLPVPAPRPLPRTFTVRLQRAHTRCRFGHLTRGLRILRTPARRATRLHTLRFLLVTVCCTVVPWFLRAYLYLLLLRFRFRICWTTVYGSLRLLIVAHGCSCYCGHTPSCGFYTLTRIYGLDRWIADFVVDFGRSATVPADGYRFTRFAFTDVLVYGLRYCVLRLPDYVWFTTF